MQASFIGNSRQVFWDDSLLDKAATTAFLRVNPPVKQTCCFLFDQPNETFSISYPSIVHDPDGYKMYYQPWNDKDLTPCVCVVESKDGLNWKRPHLDIFEGCGLLENNIVMDRVKDGCFVFYDTNPACPPEEKYKAIGLGLVPGPDGKDKRELCCYTSCDGYRFSFSHAISHYGTFDSLNTAFWNGEEYLCYFRSFHNIPDIDNSRLLTTEEMYPNSKMWRFGTRDIRVMHSKDFRSWSLPQRLTFDDEYDYPLYTNNVQLYPRAPIYIGFPVRYCERPEWNANIEQMTGYKIKRAATERLESRTGRVSTDCIFMCSRDGKHWHRFNEAFLTPGYEEQHNWIYGDCYLAYDMIDSGREYYSLYTIDRHFSFGFAKPLNRYTIRKDGFACVMADGQERRVTTKPVIFEGNTLHLNFSTSAFGFIYVSVLDEDGKPLSPGESVEVFGDNIDRRVVFAKDFDLGAYAGKPVRLAFRMRDAKLFSMKFE